MLKITDETYNQVTRLSAKVDILVFNIGEFLENEDSESHRLVLQNLVDIEKKINELKINWDG